MTKHNAENERIKRQYFAYLKEAKRHGEPTVDAAAKALHRFEEYTKYRDFKAFHTKQAIAFKRHLAEQTGQRSGEKSLMGLLLGLALRIAVLVRGINGGNSFSVEPSCPQLPPDVKRRDCPSVDDKSMKKPAFTLAFGCCWLFLDDEMVDAEGIEPSTCRLRVECSAN